VTDRKKVTCRPHEEDEGRRAYHHDTCYDYAMADWWRSPASTWSGGDSLGMTMLGYAGRCP